MNEPPKGRSAESATPADVSEGVVNLAGAWPLHHGGALSGVRLAWRLEGASAAPVVVALGGISADRHVARSGAAQRGWWSEVVGPGLALPTDRLRVLSFDYLGGSGDTTGPRDGMTFPAISSYDQAELLARLMSELGIPRLHAIVGASYGGMVALAFAERYAERVSQLVVISAADRAHPMATAWRCVQRAMIRFGLERGSAAEGVELARALAMSTYRSPEEFAQRFDTPPELEHGRFVFPVERYLFSRGRDYAARHAPQGFLTLSESIDLHRVEASGITVPVCAIAVREDQLVPVGDMRALVARLPHGRLFECSSVYGHDAFLKEGDILRPVLAPLWRATSTEIDS